MVSPSKWACQKWTNPMVCHHFPFKMAILINSWGVQYITISIHFCWLNPPVLRVDLPCNVWQTEMALSGKQCLWNSQLPCCHSRCCAYRNCAQRPDSGKSLDRMIFPQISGLSYSWGNMLGGLAAIPVLNIQLVSQHPPIVKEYTHHLTTNTASWASRWGCRPAVAASSKASIVLLGLSQGSQWIIIVLQINPN